MTYECPGCSVVFDSERGRTSHAAQTDDSQHPYESYSEVREAVDYDPGESQDGGGGGDGNGGLTRDGGSPRGPAADDPSMAAPSWGRDRDDLCPECGDVTGRLADGQKVPVRRGDGIKVEAVADGGEYICESCEIVIDGDDTYEYVQ